MTQRTCTPPVGVGRPATVSVSALVSAITVAVASVLAGALASAVVAASLAGQRQVSPIPQPTHGSPAVRGPQTAHRPELVAPGIVSTAAPEFATSLTPDGRELYFTRASADRTRLTIMVSTRTHCGSWSPPVVAAFSGTARDVDPFVSPDGRRLYFSSDRARGAAAPGVFATWYVERTPTAWGPPIDPGAPLNSEAGEVFVSAARTGTLLFTSSRLGAPRVFGSRELAGRWLAPTPVGFGTRADAGNAAIAPSGRFVVLTSAAAGGAPDLYVSCRTANGWAEPRPLDGVNSPSADFAPFIPADERMLYFTSERPGLVPAPADGARPPGDLYRIALADADVRCQ